MALDPQTTGNLGPVPTTGMGGGMGMPGAPEQASQNIFKTLQGILSRSMPRPQLPQGTPAPVPGQVKPMAGPYHNRSQGKQAFLYNLGALVSNSVAQKKENDIRKAQTDWQAIQQAWDDAEMQAGDPSSPDYEKKLNDSFLKHPNAVAILSDPKKMKNIAKSLQMDYLNPEKNKTVYREALQRHVTAEEARKRAIAFRDYMYSRVRGMATTPQMQSDPAKLAQQMAQMQEKQLESQQKAQEFAIRMTEMRQHNREMEAIYRERAADTKLSIEERKAATKELNAIRQQEQELKELDTMMKAANMR